MKVVATPGALTKSSGCDGCADAGAQSTLQLTGDGYAEFASEGVSRLYGGLSADLSAATASSTIDYAFSLWPGGGWEVRERGVYKTDGTFTAGDRFRVAVEAGRVVYRRNGALVYASAVAPAYPLAFDVTLYSTAAALTDATVVITTTTPVTVLPPPTTVPPPDPPLAGPPVFTASGPYAAVTDRSPHAKPPLPAPGPAGTTFADPVFGSTITRVTDASTRPDGYGQSFKTPSGTHQNEWNASGTLFYIAGGGGSVLPYTFDAVTGAARRVQPSATGAGGLVLGFYIEPQFSYLRSSVIYGSRSGGTLRTIDQYDFATGLYSQLLDLDALAPNLGGTYVGGVASSAGAIERVIAMFGGTRQDLHHYVVVFDAANPSDRLVVDTTASTVNGAPAGTTLNFFLHHAAMDRSGRYVMLYPTSADQASTRQAPQAVLWDTQTGVFTEMPVSALPYGHDSFGYGVWVNKDCCTTTTWDAGQWQVRSLATPLLTRDIITTVLTPKEVYLSDHSTWNNARPDNSAPVISGLFRHSGNTAAWRAWDDEIVAIQTDAAPGTEPTVWRFAHHRSNVSSDLDANGTSFWYMPRPNVSPDGHWVLFTSNWEKTLGTDPWGTPGEGARQDVFLVALKPSVGLKPSVAIAATPLGGGRVTVPYAAALAATGGGGTYRWTVTAGSLPPGLALNAVTGGIAGAPLSQGTYRATVRAGDADEPVNAASTDVAILVGDAPVQTATTTLASGRVRNTYTTTLSATGGSGLVTWAIAGGALPAGIALNATTGTLAGTPTTAGTSTFAVAATDATDPTNVATASLTLTIAPPLRIGITSPRTLPSASVGVPYSYVVQTTKAQGTLKWSLAGGSMPPGIALNAATGEIAGICLTRGTWSFNARVKDASANDTLTLTLTVK